MLSVLSLTTMMHASNPNSRFSNNRSTSNNLTKHELVNAGLDVIWPTLSPELQELKPLLSTVHIVKGTFVKGCLLVHACISVYLHV